MATENTLICQNPNIKSMLLIISLCTDICKRNGKKSSCGLGTRQKRWTMLRSLMKWCWRSTDGLRTSPVPVTGYIPDSVIWPLRLLLRFPKTSSGGVTASTSQIYRVRKTWSDSKSQLGAYKLLANAKKKADENAGYKVFDASGNIVYPNAAKPVQTPAADTSYKVQIDITNLNIRKGPGTNYGKTGQFTGKGIFTIVQESKGEGATLWGKLKSGAGWISLDFAKKV